MQIMISPTQLTITTENFRRMQLDYARLIGPATMAAEALARYDTMLKSLHNSQILLAPLRSQEALVSSRMEGTISTLDEVLRYEADHEDADEPTSFEVRHEAFEGCIIWVGNAVFSIRRCKMGNRYRNH